LSQTDAVGCVEERNRPGARAHASFLHSHAARRIGDGRVSHPWLTWSRASSPAGRVMKFCEPLKVLFAPPLSTPGPDGKNATLHGRQDARRHGHGKKLRGARCAP